MKKYFSILAAVLLLTGCTDEKTAPDSSESSVIADSTPSEPAESTDIADSTPSEPTESTVYQPTDIGGTDGSSGTPIEPRKEFPENFPEKGNINGIEYTITQGEYYNSNSRLSKIGYYIDSENRPDAPYSYLICSGEKSTGGFDIDVVNIEIDADKNAVITVKTTSPGPDEIVTCAFTYPHCIVSMYPYPKSVVIRDTEGYEYKYLGD